MSQSDKPYDWKQDKGFRKVLGDRPIDKAKGKLSQLRPKKNS